MPRGTEEYESSSRDDPSEGRAGDEGEQGPPEDDPVAKHYGRFLKAEHPHWPDDKISKWANWDLESGVISRDLIEMNLRWYEAAKRELPDSDVDAWWFRAKQDLRSTGTYPELFEDEDQAS